MNSTLLQGRSARFSVDTALKLYQLKHCEVMLEKAENTKVS